MTLDKILAISGKPGLFKLITQTRTGFLAESMLDGKRVSVGISSNVSVLSEIAIYTLAEEVPLSDILTKIKEPTPEDKPDESTVIHYEKMEFDIGLDDDFFSLRTLQR